MAYCGNYANQAVAFDVVGGKVAWTYEDRALPFFSAPAVNDRLVLIGSRDKHLHAIERQTGKPAWKFRTGGRVEGSPIVFEDGVVFGSAMAGSTPRASRPAPSSGSSNSASRWSPRRLLVIGRLSSAEKRARFLRFAAVHPLPRKPEPPGRRKRQATSHTTLGPRSRGSRGTLLPAKSASSRPKLLSE